MSIGLFHSVHHRRFISSFVESFSFYDDGLLLDFDIFGRVGPRLDDPQILRIGKESFPRSRRDFCFPHVPRSTGKRQNDRTLLLRAGA